MEHIAAHIGCGLPLTAIPGRPPRVPRPGRWRPGLHVRAPGGALPQAHEPEPSADAGRSRTRRPDPQGAAGARPVADGGKTAADQRFV